VSNVRSVVVGIALAASLVANLALALRHEQGSQAAAASSELEAARTAERDTLMELIPSVALDVGVADLEAYLGSVYSGEEIAVTEDARCLGCVVVSWRSFRFAFDETGRLSRVSVTS